MKFPSHFFTSTPLISCFLSGFNHQIPFRIKKFMYICISNVYTNDLITVIHYKFQEYRTGRPFVLPEYQLLFRE